MRSHTPPCRSGECTGFAGGPEMSSLCERIVRALGKAGGIGVFEITDCPMDALRHIATAPGDQAEEIRHKLGIVSVYPPIE